MRSAVPGSEVCENFASFHCGEFSPKTFVMSPIGFVEVVPHTFTPAGCAFVSAAVSVSRGPPPAVSDAIAAIVPDSGSAPPMFTALPTRKPVTEPILRTVSPGLTAACSGVGPPLTITALPFSSTVFAVATAPKSQPAVVYGTHGAGAFAPLGVTMFGGPPETIGSVQ